MKKYQLMPVDENQAGACVLIHVTKSLIDCFIVDLKNELMKAHVDKANISEPKPIQLKQINNFFSTPGRVENSKTEINSKTKLFTV